MHTKEQARILQYLRMYDLYIEVNKDGDNQYTFMIYTSDPNKMRNNFYWRYFFNVN